jgi:4-amino-4-deoxy-L-arabinose transferase-like glycosyltransferase
MKGLPFEYKITDTNEFSRFQPEVLIACFNQALFFGAAFLVFCLARKLFDTGVAWVTALVFLGSNLFWRFSVSGLPTIFLVVIFLGVVWSLVLLVQGVEGSVPTTALPQATAPTEPELAEKKYPVRWSIALAGMAGALVGLGGLTLYSFGALMLPIVAFLLLYFPRRRGPLVAAAVISFFLLMGPWLARNYSLSGTLYGTGGYSVYQETQHFKGNRLERSLSLDLSKVKMMQIVYKVVENLGDTVSNQLPKMGGSWVSGFFLVGLLLQFRSSTLSRLRFFLLSSMAVLVIVQALTRTHLSTESPEVNSENLLVILAPIVFMFGVGMFFVLLDQLTLPFAQARYLVIGAFVLVANLPLLLTLMPPRTPPVVYPPYYPPFIQRPCRWMEKRELLMSDMPWATAWYGNRQSMWLTLRSPFNKTNDFFLVNDYLKPVNALLLTPLSMDGRFESEMLKGDESWGNFIVGSLSTRTVPAGFPLRCVDKDYWPHHYLLMDRERWNNPSP